MSVTCFSFQGSFYSNVAMAGARPAFTISKELLGKRPEDNKRYDINGNQCGIKPLLQKV